MKPFQAPIPEIKVPPDDPSLTHQRYIRRFSHDLGNCLLAMDLQAMVLERSPNTAGDGPRLAIVRRQIGCIAELKLRLGLRFRFPVATVNSLGSLVDECQLRQRIGSADKVIDWSLDGAKACFHADLQATSALLVEIADHWFGRSGGRIEASASDGSVCFRMRLGPHEFLQEGLESLNTEVGDELIATVRRYGGTLRSGANGGDIEVTFPLATAEPTHSDFFPPP